MLKAKDYCDYETCVALKELGFREKCPTYYDTEDNVGLLYNTQWASDNTPYQFTDCLESHNAYKGNSYVDAPTMWEAQKWLREEKTIGVFVSGFKNGYTFWVNNLLNGDTLYQGFFDNQTGEKYESYEEALSEGIKEAVKILKEKDGVS